MKKALVCGAGGFIGGHLVRKLKQEGYWVRGVDIKHHEFAPSQADEFLLLDLRKPEDCITALTNPSPLKGEGKGEGDNSETFDEVYQLAADMGGMGFIHSAECEIMHNNILINIHMIHNAAEMKIPRYFFSSSVCIYRDMKPGEPELTEKEAYPAFPDNEYGWEKLYSERVAMAYGRRYGINPVRELRPLTGMRDGGIKPPSALFGNNHRLKSMVFSNGINVRIARFQNCYGPEGTWTGGREKAPAALCRKIAEVKDGDTIEVWGNGSAIRSYIYVNDLIEGIRILMQSELKDPANIGNPEYVSVKELVDTITKVAGKKVKIKWVEGPVGVQSRNFSNKRIYSLGWKPKFSLKDGIALTYPWIEEQVRKTKSNK